LQKRFCRLRFFHWQFAVSAGPLKNSSCATHSHGPRPKTISDSYLSRDMPVAAHPTENAIALSSLTEWSQEHVRAIFESSSNEEFIQAVEETFSSDIKATINGKQVGRQDIKQSVLSMRAESSSGGLKVEWKHTVEVPQDTYNRVNFFEPVLVQFLTPFSPTERIIRRFLCHSQHPTKARGRRS
jgi:hypothetical protein